jgi:hypothetical protein
MRPLDDGASRGGRLRRRSRRQLLNYFNTSGKKKRFDAGPYRKAETRRRQASPLDYLPWTMFSLRTGRFHDRRRPALERQNFPKKSLRTPKPLSNISE